MQKGITLAGGGALLRGLDRLIAEITEIPVHVADDPLTSVCRGCGVVVEDLETLKDILVNTTFERIPEIVRIFSLGHQACLLFSRQAF